jgi:hypothetical protein
MKQGRIRGNCSESHATLDAPFKIGAAILLRKCSAAMKIQQYLEQIRDSTPVHKAGRHRIESVRREINVLHLNR